MNELPVGQRYYFCYNCQTLHVQGYQCYQTMPVMPMQPISPWPQTYGPIPLTEDQVRRIFREELETALRKYLNDGK